MPENKSDTDANSSAEPPPDKYVDEVSEFVEVDPTGRYGRVTRALTYNFKLVDFLSRRL